MTPRDGVAELAELPPDSQLLLTEVWFALRVSEALELPPELQGPGREVRSGFSTIWADTDTLVYTPPQADEVVERRVDPADEPWPPLLAAVGDYLRAHDIGFVRHPRADMVSAEIQGHEAAWSLWIHTRESQRQVLVYSINPHTVDEPDRAAVTELIGRLNPKMLIGNFEMSHDGGSFRCRTSLVVNHAPLDGELLAGVIGANLTAMDDGMAALRALLDGVSVEEAAMRFPDPV
ncbi:MAG TPA: YbjN domain-containing protein [Ilumatobacter sp.]